MSELTLHVDAFFISPYAFSAFVALEEKAIPYTLRTVALDRREHREPGYRDRSLTGRVPALADGDFWLSESSAMVEYVEERAPPPGHPRLLPEDLRERARCRQLMAWVRSDLMPIREERPTTTMFYERAGAPLSPAGQSAAETLLRVAETLIGDGRPTLFSAWCIADADLGFMLQRLHLNGHPVSPKVAAYCDAQWRRPSVRKWAERERPAYSAY